MTGRGLKEWCAMEGLSLAGKTVKTCGLASLEQNQETALVEKRKANREHMRKYRAAKMPEDKRVSYALKAERKALRKAEAERKALKKVNELRAMEGLPPIPELDGADRKKLADAARREYQRRYYKKTRLRGKRLAKHNAKRRAERAVESRLKAKRAASKEARRKFKLAHPEIVAERRRYREAVRAAEGRAIMARCADNLANRNREMVPD